jgi:FtsH-binding integral membrane protein
MPEQFDRRYAAHTTARPRADASVDEGLRSYMLSVYNYMASGVLLTGIVAAIVAASPALAQLFYRFAMAPNGQQYIAGYTGLGWVALLAPLGVVFFLSFGQHRMSAKTAQLTFWGFAALMGLSLSSIFFLYTGASLARVFFITAASFGALSLWGYTTKKDLTGMGTFLFMGLVGIIIASLVNLFMQSSALYFIVSVAGVLIFAGLTAYDTQKIKEGYYMVDAGEGRAKMAVMGALRLYLDFINLFLMLLRLFGDRR